MWHLRPPPELCFQLGQYTWQSTWQYTWQALLLGWVVATAPVAKIILASQLLSSSPRLAPLSLSLLFHHNTQPTLCIRATHRRLSTLNLFLGHEATLTNSLPHCNRVQLQLVRPLTTCLVLPQL